MAFLGKRRVVGLREGRGLITSHTVKRAWRWEKKEAVPSTSMVSLQV